MSVHSRTLMFLDQKRSEMPEPDFAFEAMAELALNLARSLDAGAGLAQAAVSREFRTVMNELTKEAASDDADDFGDWASGLGVAGVSPLGNAS